MGIRLQQFPEHELSLRVVSGTTTADDVIRLYEGLDTSHGTRWITYVDVDPAAGIADEIPVARIPEIKRVMTAKMQELFAGQPVRIAVVCASSSMEFVHNFWRSYTSGGDAHPADHAVFTCLDKAFEWLDLPEAGRSAVKRAVEALVSAEKGVHAPPTPVRSA